MLTIFTVPKPFCGHIGDIQRNAVASWRALDPEVQVILVGDEAGVAEVARETGVEHIGGLACNDRGTPRLDSAFQRVETIARQPLHCFVNADIVLLDDFLPAVKRVAAAYRRFLIVGESRDLELPSEIDLADAEARARLRRNALREGVPRGYAALDFFVFPAAHFGDLPPFLIGRACFDNWLVWRARHMGPVVDATRSVVSVHQPHDYSHISGGWDEAYYGEEARFNEQLAGGRSRIYSLHDVSHRLNADGVICRYWGSMFRARENARKAHVRLRIRLETELEALRERKSHLRPTRVVGVFPEPTPYRSPLLDEVARCSDVDLSVLYAAGTVARRTWLVEPRHTHWVMRGFRLSGAERILRHEYPVNWAIWRALFNLHPDCLVVSGWSTFAAQASILWCRLRRIPYLLVVESHDRHRRSLWRRAVKDAVVPWVVRNASGVLVAGSLARESMLARGARPDRIRLFANTVDVEAFGEQADALEGRRDALRRTFGLAKEDIAVLSVARLAPEKGLDKLIRAAAAAENPRLSVVIAGEGPDRERLSRLATALDVRLILLGDVEWTRIVELYVASDVFALLSERETWGVVVNEAAACGLPLVLSQAVGSAPDLVADGKNGRIVPVGDVAEAAQVLSELAGSPTMRAKWSAASREIAAGWGYEASVRGLVELLRLAVDERRAQQRDVRLTRGSFAQGPELSRLRALAARRAHFSTASPHSDGA